MNSPVAPAKIQLVPWIHARSKNTNLRTGNHVSLCRLSCKHWVRCADPPKLQPCTRCALTWLARRRPFGILGSKPFRNQQNINRNISKFVRRKFRKHIAQKHLQSSYCSSPAGSQQEETPNAKALQSVTMRILFMWIVGILLVAIYPRVNQFHGKSPRHNRNTKDSCPRRQKHLKALSPRRLPHAMVLARCRCLRRRYWSPRDKDYWTCLSSRPYCCVVLALFLIPFLGTDIFKRNSMRDVAVSNMLGHVGASFFSYLASTMFVS